MPDVELVLAGDGPERARLMELSRTLGAGVKFPGLLTRREIIGLLQSATVYALPSTAEAFPIALLEAMACGIPTVVSKGLGLEQIVEGTGFVADPKEPQEWEQKLETLLADDGLRRGMSTRAREVAVTQYDWDTIADKLEKLFVTVAESGQKRDG